MTDVKYRTAAIVPAAPPPAPLLACLPPVFHPHARLLILGSFPGVASLGARQYYAHPRNLFWPAMTRVTGVDLSAMEYPARLEQLRRHGIALWDVIGHCSRQGSLDGAIRDATDQDFAGFVARLPRLRAVAFNGQLAASREPWFRDRGFRTYRLPSTSPAYAAIPRDVKLDAWNVLASELATSAAEFSSRPRARRRAPG